MENTGRMSLRRADLPLYQVRNKNARFRGIENELKFPINQYINIFTTLSYINGTFTSFSKQPVPQMPPLLWQAGLTWSHDPLNLRFTSRGAAKQSRLGGFEEPTNAYQVFDLDIQYHFFKQERLNTLQFVINNVTDSVYRNHLNRLK